MKNQLKLVKNLLLLGVFLSTAFYSTAQAYSPAVIDYNLPSFQKGTNVEVTKEGSANYGGPVTPYANHMNVKINGGANSVGTATWNI